MSSPNYATTELDIAAFLHASGYHLIDAQPFGHIVRFIFEPGAVAAVEEYFAGKSLPVRDVFQSHRQLRTTIKQIKSHHGASNGNPRKY